MRRPNFEDLNPVSLYKNYTSNIDPQTKMLVDVGLISAGSMPVVAGIVDANSGPTNAYNSNENMTNMGLTALVPAAAIGGGYAAQLGIQDPQKYADGRVPPGMETAYQAIYGEDVGTREYHNHRNTHVGDGLKKRNTRAGVGAALAGIGAATAASGAMMDQYPQSLTESLSMKDRQEIDALLRANGAI